MKNQTTTGCKAIAKTILMMCAVLLAVSVNAQADYTQGRDYHNKAARMLQRADGETNDSLRKIILEQANVYADSAKACYQKEHKRLTAEQSRYAKNNNAGMASFYTLKDSALGKDTTNINYLHGEINKGLRKFQKPQTPAAENKPAATEKKNTAVPAPNAAPITQNGSAVPKSNTGNATPQDATVVRRNTDSIPPSGDGQVKTEMIELQLRSSTPVKIDSVKPAQTVLPEPERKGLPEKEISKVIVTDAAAPTENRNSVSWELGADAGLTWSGDGVTQAEPVFEHVMDNSFGTQEQLDSLMNEIFGGMVFPSNDETKFTNYPGWQLGINAGCFINEQFEIKLAVAGGTYISKGEQQVKVVKMVPPSSPSAPPATKQSTEKLQYIIPVGNFNARLTGRFYFGAKVKGYAEAGAVMGLNHAATVQMKAADYTGNKSVNQTIIYGGGTVGAGVRVPLTKMLSFETGAVVDLVALNKNFSFNTAVNAGLRISF